MSAKRCKSTHHKMRGKNGKKRPRAIMRTLSQFLCEEIGLYCFFLRNVGGSVLHFYVYQYRDHSASSTREWGKGLKCTCVDI